MDCLGVVKRSSKGLGDGTRIGHLLHWYYTLGGKQTPLPPLYDHVFLHKKNGIWHTTNIAFYMGQLRRLGVIPPDCTAYMLRHKFATDAILNHVPIQLVSELLGHSDVTMTQHYLHVAGDVAPLRDALEQATKSVVRTGVGTGGPGRISACKRPASPTQRLTGP